MGTARQLAHLPDAERARHEGDLRHERDTDGRHQGGTLRYEADGDCLERARTRAVAAVDDYAAELRRVDGVRLGEGLIDTRAMKDRLEAVFAEGLRRFDESGEYAADGALDLVAWLRAKCKLSGGAAAERVGIARQLQHLPQTSKAFATGQLAYQHVAVLARTAEHVGAGA